MPDEDLGAQLVDLIDAAADPVTFDEVRARNVGSSRVRGRVAAVVAVAAVIATALGAAVVITRDRGTTPRRPTRATVATTPTSPSTPSTNDPVDALPKLGPSAVHQYALPADLQPDQAIAVDGALWMVGLRVCIPECPPAPTLWRLDPAAGTVTGIPGTSFGGIDVAYGDGTLWLLSDRLDGSPYEVTHVDLPSARVRFTVDVPDTHVYGNTNPRGRIAYGFGSVWVYEGNEYVARLDAETGRQLARITLPTTSNGLAVNAHGVWSVEYGNTSVTRIDPATNEARIVANFGPGFAQSIAASDGAVWTTNVVRILDLYRSEEIKPQLFEQKATGVPTADVAASDGDVWFLGWIPGEKVDSPRNHPGLVGQLDPETLEVTGVTELPIGPLDKTQFVVGAGAAWVVDSTTHQAWRIDSGS